MSNTILKFENVSKQYRLGLIGTGTITHDLNRWWYRIRGKEDPYLKIGQTNDRAIKGDSQYVWALKDINFVVNRGDVLGIIGKNGAGKSTLLKILSKVTSPTTGVIKSKGRIASLLEVGTGFHPELTGRENIYLNGAILGMTKAEIASKLDEIVDFSGCERYIDTPVKRYSSGMKVRLAFAVAAHLEPEILVVDEVLAVGDAEFQKKAIGKMQDISKGEGRTVLFVSHDMNAIKNLCNSLSILENGKNRGFNCVEEGIDYYLLQNIDNNVLDDHIRDNISIENFEMVKDEVSVKSFDVFSKISIRFEIEFLDFIPPDLKVEIYIIDNFGQLQTTISSWLNSIVITPRLNSLCFECVLTHGFSLNAGTYKIDMSLFTNKRTDFNNVFSFYLRNSEVTGYKHKLVPQKHGKVYTPNKWKVG